MALAINNQSDYRVNDVNQSMRSYEVGSITLFGVNKNDAKQNHLFPLAVASPICGTRHLLSAPDRQTK